MKIYAPAKINLVLELLGRRTDGYHNLRSIMQTVTLADELIIEKNTIYRLRFQCKNMDADSGDKNLAVVAAEAFYRELGQSPSVDITLTKKIPVAAGLGGGSSDAAAVLRGLNKMHNAPFSPPELRAIGSSLGSDVPFFIDGGTALAEGRGEKITLLPFIGKLLILLVNPGFPVSTARVYASCNLDLTTPRRLHNILPALSKGKISAEKLTAAVHNDLQPTVIDLFPPIGYLLRWLKDNGAGCAAVSGSGGTVFGVFMDTETAKQAASLAAAHYPWSCLVETADTISF